jgi:hypothetical protein
LRDPGYGGVEGWETETEYEWNTGRRSSGGFGDGSLCPAGWKRSLGMRHLRQSWRDAAHTAWMLEEAAQMAYSSIVLTPRFNH